MSNILQSEKRITNPVVKWAGGKRQLLSELKTRLPKKFNRYFEPFIGGGALFFELQPKNGYISDINVELINLYITIRDNLSDLIDDLHCHVNSLEYYTEIRDLDRAKEYKLLSGVKKASRFLYLNKTCYNGLYRVNKDGFFNVPFGKYSNPKIFDIENLLNVSEILKNTQIECASYDKIINFVKKDDFVYLDPPYIPLSESSSFTSYSKENFLDSDHIELKKICDSLDSMGVKFMLSNSDCIRSNELYSEYKIEKLYASRFINSKSNGRGKISEILVRNY